MKGHTIVRPADLEEGGGPLTPRTNNQVNGGFLTSVLIKISYEVWSVSSGTCFA